MQAERQQLESSVAQVKVKLQLAHDQRGSLTSVRDDLKQRLHEVTANLADILCPRTEARAGLPSSPSAVAPRHGSAAAERLASTPRPDMLANPARARSVPADAQLRPRVQGYFASRGSHIMDFEDYQHYEVLSAEMILAADPHINYDDLPSTLPEAATKFMATKAAALRRDPDSICWWYQAPHAVAGEALSFSVSIASPECMASMFLYFFMHALEGCFLLEAKSILEGAATPCAPPTSPPLPTGSAPARLYS